MKIYDNITYRCFWCQEYDLHPAYVRKYFFLKRYFMVCENCKRQTPHHATSYTQLLRWFGGWID